MACVGFFYLFIFSPHFQDEKRKHYNESREHPDLKRSGEEVRHHRSGRDRGEWDKRKERRHREEEDPEKKQRELRHREEEEPDSNHIDRTSTKKSSSDKSHRHETNTTETEVSSTNKLPFITQLIVQYLLINEVFILVALIVFLFSLCAIYCLYRLLYCAYK